MRDIPEIFESPARLSSSKSSPSEFEFSMCSKDHDGSYGHPMLAADELFCDGKLLPLYTTTTHQAGVPSVERSTVGQRRSITEQSIRHIGHVEEMSRVKIDNNPISPKAPTCTSRWKELLGLKKVQNQDVKDVSNGGRQHKKSACSSNTVTPGRRSLDSVKDSKVSLALIKNSKHGLSHKESHLHHPGEVYEEFHEGLNHGEQMQYHGSQRTPCDPLFSTTLPPTVNRTAWQMDRAMSGSRSWSKSPEDSDSSTMDANGAGGATAMKLPVRRTAMSRAQISPIKPREQGKLASAAMNMSLRSGGNGVGSKGFLGNGAMESSRSAVATGLVVRGLDRSYSNPKTVKKRAEQVRYGRQRFPMDGSMSLERCPSYSGGVRVAPVINVHPMYITPGLTKGSKNGIFGLFSSKKDKNPHKLSTCATSHHADA